MLAVHIGLHGHAPEQIQLILGFDKRYVFLPVVLSIALVVGAYVVVEASQNRLRDSAQKAAQVQSRLRALGSVLRLTTDAETGTRGYLLTNDPVYLEPFEAAEKSIDGALADVRDQYPVELTREQTAWLRKMRDLVSAKMATMQMTVAFQKEQGQAAATKLLRTDVEKRTMDAIRELIREQQVDEGQNLRRISDESRRDLMVARIITAAGTLLNILLVIIAGILITREIKRRLAEGRALEYQKLELERQVAIRTQELSTLSSYLQEISEREKAALARELHDELGGLLVAAKMDISALRKKFGDGDPDVRARWTRVLESLDAGVNLKRRVVDQLHPTLLDTMGLYAAIRWQFKESCGRAGLKCTETIPEHELPLSKEAAIAIFRVAQESMTNILKHAKAAAADLRIAIDDHEMIMTIRDDGIGYQTASRKPGAGWASMRHRTEALGGSWIARPGPGGRGTEIEVRLPMDRIQVAPA